MIAELSSHEFVRRDNPDGEHRDRKCAVCGLKDSNPLHGTTTPRPLWHPSYGTPPPVRADR